MESKSESKACDGEFARLSSEDKMAFVLRFAEHVDGRAFNQRCTAYLKDHMHVVDFSLDKDECSHEYWDIYVGYQHIVEEMLEDFVRAEGIQRPSELFERLEACYEANSFASEYIEFCISCMSFEAFAACLKGYWRQFSQNHGLTLDTAARDVDDGADDEEGRIESKTPSRARGRKK
jgi:hypothetical protein